MSSSPSEGDDGELVLSVVRRLHAGDTPLHSRVRAATYMEVEVCARKIRELLARDPGAADAPNADACGRGEKLKLSNPEEKVSIAVRAAVLDPNGAAEAEVAAEAAREVMQIIAEAAPAESSLRLRLAVSEPGRPQSNTH